MTKIYRVRELSCDGGHLGKTWEETFFFDVEDAESHLKKLIKKSNEQNPQYPYVPQAIDGLRGFCNWQFGIMIALDYISVKPQRKQ